MENLDNQNMAAYERAAKKSKEGGFFALTLEDHLALGSTPDDELENNPGKSQCEVMSLEEIEGYLNSAVDAIRENDEYLKYNGYIDQQKDFLRASIPFLTRVGRLPEKFRDFDLNSL
ncbi:MAG: hypothetical protein ACM3PZ_01490 [Bacillota bacterium]